MNKKIAFMVLSLLLSVGFASSCGDDEEPSPSQPTQPTTPQDSTEVTPVDTTDVTPVDTTVILPTSAYLEGWTSATHVPPEGGRQYFVDYHSTGEQATVELEKSETGLLTMRYASDAWGVAVFDSLEVQEADGRYILPAGTKTTIVMERGAMGQQGGGGEYELTLLEASISTELKELTLVMSAFMNPNHGSYELTFHEGDLPEPAVQ